MLEQCLSNFGGLGRMGEHFVPYVYRARRNALVRLANRLLGEERLPPRFRQARASQGPRAMLPRDLVAVLRAGSDRQGNCGVTVMADYATTVAQGYFGLAPQQEAYDVKLVQSFLKDFGSAFSEVKIIRHRRENVLDQALSRYFMRRTGVAHDMGDSKVTSARVAPKSKEEIAATLEVGEVLRILAAIDRENGFLDELARLMALPTLELTYEEVLADSAAVAGRVADFSGRKGDAARFAARTRKVSDEKTVREAKNRIAESLKLEAGGWSDESLIKAARQAAKST